MKTQNKPIRSQLPPDRKSAHPLFGSLTALAAGLALIGAPSSALAQSDNFNDGDDVSPVLWTEFDPISTIAGLPAQNTWSFPGGNTYQFQATPSPSPGTLGPARVSSFPPDVYTDFYQSVDVVAVDNTAGYSVFGMLARAGDFSTAGTPTTRGYGFIYAPGSAIGDRDFIAIFRLRDDAQTSGVPGSSGTSAEVDVTLDPTKDYRMVFIGHGPHLEGRVYELPNLTTPVAVVYANTTGTTPEHLSGQSGLLAFSLIDSPPTALYGGPVNVTFDNYYASARCPMTITDMVIKDDFNDGNDTSPVAWTHYDPISQAVGPAQNTWSFPGGNTYRLEAPVQPFNPALGQGRAGSIEPTTHSDFRVAIDIVNWDVTLDQDFGIGARLAGPIGLGTTTGYLMSYDFSGGFGDIDISSLAGELPTSVPLTGEDSYEMVSGKSYRYVFSGKGSALRAMVFELPETMNPLIDCIGTDALYASGKPGLIVSAGSDLETADVTFDNFSDTPVATPAIALAVGSTGGGAITVGWPFDSDCIWVLQSTTSLVPVPVWTDVPLVDIVYAAGQNVYTGPAPMVSSPSTYYRLKQL